jgi:hypothetical protein
MSSEHCTTAHGESDPSRYHSAGGEDTTKKRKEHCKEKGQLSRKEPN